VACNNGDAVTEIAEQFLALAERQGATVPLVVGHRMMGISLLMTGDFVQARTHLDKGIALYDPDEHHPLAARFGQDSRVSILGYRSWTLWLLGYPNAASTDTNHVLKYGREIGHAATLLYALAAASMILMLRGNCAAANTLVDEGAALADEKGVFTWKAIGMANQGMLLVLKGKASGAVQMITSAITACRSTGWTMGESLYLPYLARAYAELGQFDDAWRCLDEVMATVGTTKQRWCEPEIHRTAGEIALMSPDPHAAKAEAYFERALAVAREQQARCWEMRAAMSMARLWRDQRKRQQAHDLLAPIYGWFTEDFDTLDLKGAKSLREQLKA
jgi:predicted ATPase